MLGAQREKLHRDAVATKAPANRAGIQGAPGTVLCGIISVNSHKALVEQILSVSPFCRCRG